RWRGLPVGRAELVGHRPTRAGAGGARRRRSGATGATAMAHDFLSDEWMDAIEALRPEAPEPPAATKDLVINLVVPDTPFGEREAHMAGGQFERGLHDAAPTKLTVPYEVAKSVFIAGDQQAA